MKIELQKEDKTICYSVQNAEDNIYQRISDIALLEIKLKELKEETLDAYSKGFTSYQEYNTKAKYTYSTLDLVPR